jgi:hypothetical protein
LQHHLVKLGKTSWRTKTLVPVGSRNPTKTLAREPVRGSYGIKISTDEIIQELDWILQADLTCCSCQEKEGKMELIKSSAYQMRSISSNNLQ